MSRKKIGIISVAVIIVLIIAILVGYFVIYPSLNDNDSDNNNNSSSNSNINNTSSISSNINENNNTKIEKIVFESISQNTREHRVTCKYDTNGNITSLIGYLNLFFVSDKNETVKELGDSINQIQEILNNGNYNNCILTVSHDKNYNVAFTFVGLNESNSTELTKAVANLFSVKTTDNKLKINNFKETLLENNYVVVD